jgi:hypothetical protein
MQHYQMRGRLKNSDKVVSYQSCPIDDPDCESTQDFEDGQDELLADDPANDVEADDADIDLDDEPAEGRYAGDRTHPRDRDHIVALGGRDLPEYPDDDEDNNVNDQDNDMDPGYVPPTGTESDDFPRAAGPHQDRPSDRRRTTPKPTFTRDGSQVSVDWTRTAVKFSRADRAMQLAIRTGMEFEDALEQVDGDLF